MTARWWKKKKQVEWYDCRSCSNSKSNFSLAGKQHLAVFQGRILKCMTKTVTQQERAIRSNIPAQI